MGNESNYWCFGCGGVTLLTGVPTHCPRCGDVLWSVEALARLVMRTESDRDVARSYLREFKDVLEERVPTSAYGILGYYREPNLKGPDKADRGCPCGGDFGTVLKSRDGGVVATMRCVHCGLPKNVGKGRSRWAKSGS